MMPLSEKELRYCDGIALRLDRIRALLASGALEHPPRPSALFAFLAELRLIQGNLSNDVSFAATLLARDFLAAKFGIVFDAASKPQGASGIDIIASTSCGERIVAEIKTTVPYRAADLGANQQKSFQRDFEKLARADARHKFLFVTDARTFDVLRKPKYQAQLTGVQIINLAALSEALGA